jgi:hypothetical protein
MRKAGLLHAALLLPFAFQIALTILRSELLEFTQAEIDELVARGLSVIDLPAEEVGRALTYRSAFPALSFNDCLSMVLAERQAGSILLTGDQGLRNRASAMGIEVHGILWVSDQLENSGCIPVSDLHDGLVRLDADPLVFVPKNELVARIERLKKLLG